MRITSPPDPSSDIDDDKPQIRVIEGQRLVFHRGEGWRCDCAAWVARADCRHVWQAAALVTLERAIQSRGNSIRRH
jgi:hypothetical protein